MNADNFYSITQSLWHWFGPTPLGVISDLWILFCLYWLVSALNRKKTKRRESSGQRMAYVLPLVVAFYLLYHQGLRYPWLLARFVPDTTTVQWLAVLVMASGVAIAFWARFHLGANWSGVVTLKEGHELIRTGPYRTIRHPIYTGILLAFLGNAVALGEVRGLIGLAIIWLSFYVKARREESFLAQEFGTRFNEHTQHTGMFLPKFS
ncbi:MAG: isoprenylcysteine carboxylmethyltransferase family protein [Candidatus Acidiferrum sp.]|jgi:protein-S-isoprenylcysteine O-methyltransferase Ste14